MNLQETLATTRGNLPLAADGPGAGNLHKKEGLPSSKFGDYAILTNGEKYDIILM